MASLGYGEIKLFSGNANPELATAIAAHLGLKLGDAKVSRFSDGEVQVEIGDNVRGRDVYIIQPTCAPANDHLMELLIMGDACKRASAGRLTAVIPYYGYSRQDRKVAPRLLPSPTRVTNKSSWCRMSPNSSRHATPPQTSIASTMR